MAKAEFIDESLAQPFEMPSEPPDVSGKERQMHVLRVTPEDIGRGVPGDGRHCAIARAFGRWCQENKIPVRELGVGGGSLSVSTYNFQYQMDLPQIATEFIRAYDNRRLEHIHPIDIPLDPRFVDELFWDRDKTARRVVEEMPRRVEFHGPSFVELYEQKWAVPHKPSLKIHHHWDVAIKPDKAIMFDTVTA